MRHVEHGTYKLRLRQEKMNSGKKEGNVDFRAKKPIVKNIGTVFVLPPLLANL